MLTADDLVALEKLLRRLLPSPELPYLLGTQLVVTEVQVPIVVSTVKQLVQADPTRVALVICNPISTPLNISTLPGVTQSTGTPLFASQPRIEMNINTHGTMVQLAWFGICATGGAVTVFTIQWKPNGGI